MISKSDIEVLGRLREVGFTRKESVKVLRGLKEFSQYGNLVEFDKALSQYMK